MVPGLGNTGAETLQGLPLVRDSILIFALLFAIFPLYHSVRQLPIRRSTVLWQFLPTNILYISLPTFLFLLFIPLTLDFLTALTLLFSTYSMFIILHHGTSQAYQRIFC